MSAEAVKTRLLERWGGTFSASQVDPEASGADPGATLRPPPGASTLPEPPTGVDVPTLLEPPPTSDAAPTRADAREPEGGAPAPALDLSAELALGEVLGRGGMGVVRRAEQRSLGRVVAVKTLGEHARGREQRRAFLQEARLTARLDHPNVVPIYALGRDEDGQTILAMKRIEGHTWSELLDARPPADGHLREHVEVLSRVLDAMAFAHSQGVIHRDLKPENVMVGAYGQVYVLDWGLALELGPEGWTSPAAMAGTPAYMAPEMADGEGALCAATDVYLLGAILHQLLTGRPPHRGSSLVNVLVAALANDLLPLRPSFPAPAALVELASRCLATSPAERFADAGQLRGALQAFVSGEQDREASREQTAAAAGILDALPDLDALSQAEAAEHYAQLLQADARLQGALQRWPENRDALALQDRLAVELIRCALASGDLALARSFLDRARAVGARVDGLEAEIARRRYEADPEYIGALDSARRRVRAVAGLGALATGYLGLIAPGIVLVTQGVDGLEVSYSLLMRYLAYLSLPLFGIQAPLYLLALDLRPRARLRYRGALALTAAALTLCLAASVYWARELKQVLPLLGVCTLGFVVLYVYVLGSLVDGRVRRLFREPGDAG